MTLHVHKKRRAPHEMHAKPTVRKCNANSPTKIHSLDYLATLFSTLKKKWLDDV